MGKPFLGREDRLSDQRADEIEKAVTAYLNSEHKDELPEPLEWLWRLQAHKEICGTAQLREGGLLDQPAQASRDIEAAYLALKKWQTDKITQESLEQVDDELLKPASGGQGFLEYIASTPE